MTLDLQDFTDQELFQWMDMAHADLMKAAEEQPNSEWHADCFFAMLTLCNEANRRGIKRHYTH